MSKAIFIIAVALFFSFGINASSAIFSIQTVKPEEALSLSQIEGLIQNEIPDATIISEIRQRGITFHLTNNLLLRLKAKKASPEVISALRTAQVKKANGRVQEKQQKQKSAVSQTKRPISDSTVGKRPKLWITYAIENAKGGNFNFLDIGENRRLKPAFLAAFFAFDDKVSESEEANNSD